MKRFWIASAVTVVSALSVIAALSICQAEEVTATADKVVITGEATQTQTITRQELDVTEQMLINKLNSVPQWQSELTRVRELKALMDAQKAEEDRIRATQEAEQQKINEIRAQEDEL